MALGREMLAGRPVIAFGHRVVHGGVDYAAPVRVDAAVMADLAKLIPLAPLHQPHNLAPMAAIAKAAPHLPQIACFDTAFHRTQPALAQEFALPREITASGVRRYGFHGLSYDYVVRQVRKTLPLPTDAKLVVAHLGNGASLCAVRDGRSVASTMGFTAVDGLVMGTRTGALDPGVLLYLMQERGYDAGKIEDLIYRRSGLLGVSGLSSDMRTLRQSRAPEAGEAIALFVYRIVREIGSLAAAMEASMRSCSRPGSARTMRRPEQRSPKAADGWAWSSTRCVTSEAIAASASPVRRSRPGSSRPTRNA